MFFEKDGRKLTVEGGRQEGIKGRRKGGKVGERKTNVGRKGCSKKKNVEGKESEREAKNR